ncbi:MAG: hypothetical protein HRT69_14810 [Flavobacteriaceae bacterium]|nr:hypothetical protein [Flavobacteriaceae bacterium]
MNFNWYNTTSPNPLSTDVAGMVVYNTATTGDVTPGFYYNNDRDWLCIDEASTTSWSLTGNTGTTAGVNFIGATDNVERVRIDTDGHIRATTTVGGNTPSYSWQGE